MTPGASGAVFAGVGFSTACTPDEIVAVVRDACARAGRSASSLAAPAFKSGAPALREAAAALGIPVVLVAGEALAAAQPRCPTRGARVERATGVSSVAEGSALAAAGDGGRLVLARIAGARATCALAEVGRTVCNL